MVTKFGPTLIEKVCPDIFIATRNKKVTKRFLSGARTRDGSPGSCMTSPTFALIFFSQSLTHSFNCINVPSEIALAQLRTGKKRTAIRRPDHEQRIWEKSSHTVPTLCIEETKLRFSSTNIRLIMHAPMFASLCPIFNRTYIVMHCKVLPMEICAFELLLQQLLNLLLK